MRKRDFHTIALIAILICFITDNVTAQKNSLSHTHLSGKVTDKKTHEPLSGVIISIPDLKTGTTSDSSGNYTFNSLPKTKVLIQVNYIGFKTLIQTVDLTQTTVQNFELEYSATELNEVVISGLSKASEQKRTPSPVSIIPKTVLLQNASTNVIDAISRETGISQITTGAGISKPVIRGLGYNRVVVVNDGIRQEGQQWGDEHGIEVDEYAVNKVEILKGPASLVYGSDAMAGVINLISAPAVNEGKIMGNVIANYQTNNGLIGYSADLAGNKKGFLWDLRYSNKLAYNYQNKYDGYVFNSGFREHSISGMAGINRSWGYVNLILSDYYFKPGIVEGERDSLSGKFLKSVAAGDTFRNEIVLGKGSYNPSVPYQIVNHYKAVINSNVVIRNGSLSSVLGFQQNRRQEFANVLHPDQYGLYFLLNTWNYDFKYNLPEKNDMNISFGINGMAQQSFNKGSEFLVPEYNLFDFGIFSIFQKTFGQIDISGGLRFDSRTETGKELFLNTEGQPVNPDVEGSVLRFPSFHSSFSGVSGSIGATWQISKEIYTKLNFSRGYRAPNIAELGSNGIHEGTARYEIGDPDLKAEYSWQTDFTLGWNSEHVSAEMNLFSNQIQNYIYVRKLTGTNGTDSISDGFSTFKFVSGNASLSGGEIRFDIHPHPYDWIHFENSFSYVRAIQNHQSDSTKYLPFIPAPRLMSTIRFDVKKWGKTIRNGYAQIEMENDFAQNNIFSAYHTETRTPAYTLLNIGIGSDFIKKNYTFLSVYLSIDNLFDIGYQNHLSRLKYLPVNYSTGRTGVFNMGRNVNLKITFPID